MEHAEINQTNDEILVSIVNAQTEQAAELISQSECLKQYLRSARMMSRVCLAGAVLGTENEKDVQALSYLLGEVEAWVNYQNTLAQDNFARIAYTNVVLQDAIARACADAESAAAEAIAADTE